MAQQPYPDGGGWQKWGIGAVFAAVLVAGGYFAWKTFAAPSPDDLPEQAYVEEQPATPYTDDIGDDESALKEEPVAPPPAKAKAPRRTTTASDEPIEAVVGVAPVDLTTTTTTTTPTETEEIVVPGARRPLWSRTPSARRMATIYPERELQQGREGEAQLRCTVQVDGALDCARVSESSAGFGRAAMRLSRLYRHGPERWDGAASVGSTLNLRVVFRVSDSRRRRG